MNKLDNFIKDVLEKEINEPEEYEKSIRNAFNKKSNRRNHMFQKISTLITFLLMGCTVVLASNYVIYEKIMKKPEKVKSYNTDEKIGIEVTEEDKTVCITEEEAKQKALEILEKFGYKNEVIEKVELVGSPINYYFSYSIITENKHGVSINARNPETYCITPETDYVDSYGGIKEEHEEYVRELCKNQGIDLSEYKCKFIRYNKMVPEESNIWFFYFYKKYGNVVNTYEEVSVAIYPKNHQLFWFRVTQEPFDNNEIVVTEEEAKQIVLDIEKNIPTGLEIKDIYANLDITETNGDAYERINDYEQSIKVYSDTNQPEYIEHYRTDYRIRRAWMVAVAYDIEDEIWGDDTIIPKCYTYFIDVTTGEVLGGIPYYLESWYKFKNGL